MTIIAQKREEGMELCWGQEMTPVGNWNPQEEIKYQKWQMLVNIKHCIFLLSSPLLKDILFKAIIKTLYWWVYYINEHNTYDNTGTRREEEMELY